jgi:hypothetical protein
VFDHCLGLVQGDVMIVGWMGIHGERGSVQDLMDGGDVLADVGVQWLWSC